MILVRFLDLKFLHKRAAIMIGTSNPPHYAGHWLAPKPMTKHHGCERSCKLGNDEGRHSGGCYPRKGVGKRPGNGDCRVGEGGGGREPKARGAVGPHRVRTGFGPPPD